MNLIRQRYLDPRISQPNKKPVTMSIVERTDSPVIHRPQNDDFDWEIDSVVQALRAVRDDALQVRNRINNPVTLPSKRSLAELIEVISSALFPHRLSSRQLQRESVDFFVGQALDAACRSLTTQFAIELEYLAETKANRQAILSEASRRVKQVIQLLPEIRKQLDCDVQAAFVADPAARSLDEVLACYPGVTALIHYRLAHQIYRLDLPLVARMISELAHSKTGIDIHPGAQIAESFFIDHGTGVVIGETSIIGKNVRIHHGVTLGATPDNQRKPIGSATRSFSIPRHPIVEDDVTIYADATILGRVTIGKGSIIGGNVCITTDIPPFSKVSQAQSRLDTFIEGAGI